MSPSPQDDTGAARSLVSSLKARLLAEVERAIGRNRTVALLDFPNHPNAGDTAIWLGERAALTALGIEVAYVASFSSWSARAVRRRIGASGTVVLHGGGNFGDIWPTYQAFRERIAAAHADQRLVLMPQSAHWRDPSVGPDRTRLLARHPDLVVMARDHPTYDTMTTLLDQADVRLVPDAAFALAPLVAPPPDTHAVWMLRTDLEGTLERDRVMGPDITDWARPTRRLTARYRVSRLLGYPLKRWETPIDGALELALARTFNGLAAQRLSRGLDLIASGQILVTDRLHGHILGLLLGRPQIVLDNEYGKIQRFRDAWTSSSPITTAVRSIEEAKAAADAALTSLSVT